jgi:membrane fusion protein (multidrug efflux system)
MADPVLKFPAEQKQKEGAPASDAPARGGLAAWLRRHRRLLLLVVLPLVVALAGIWFYLAGGR